MSMSDFHPESWNPLWSVATIIQGIQSFMASDELTTGGMKTSEADRKKFAKLSIPYNAKNFPSLFQGDIEGAMKRADEASQKALEEMGMKAAALDNGGGRAARRAARKCSRAVAIAEADNDENEDNNDEEDVTDGVETLSLEEQEKRRKRNAKKRAKQKAKKAAGTAGASPGNAVLLLALLSVGLLVEGFVSSTYSIGSVRQKAIGNINVAAPFSCFLDESLDKRTCSRDRGSRSITTFQTLWMTTSDENSSSDENLPEIKKSLTREFLTIGIPAFIQLAAEPLAALVDTAYLGRLGPEVLGGAGVAISAQYSVSKLYNDPLLRTSISLVASQDGQARGTSDADDDEAKERNKKQLSIAVSSALLLAFCVGTIQLLVFSVLSSSITRGMGVTPSNAMWHSAVSYLQVRALGTPAATLWLVTNGIFRGLGDTRTPLIYSFFFTALNAILDPLFIFTFHFGASGAAAGTALAQYTALVPLMLALNRKVKIDIIGQLSDLRSSLKSYLQAGGLVLFRTLGKVLAYSVCARQAALLGSVGAAAYNLTFQLGFATTQICEAVAVAVQTLLARELADKKTHSPAVKAKVIRHIINTSLLIGGGVATALSLTTYLQKDSVLRGLTTNIDVQNAARVIFPAVLTTQVFKGLAYPVNGIIMGGLDWVFTMIAMWAANFVCVGMIRGWGAGGAIPSLNHIWWALAAFMATQVVTGIIRYQSKTGVWSVLKGDQKVASV
jgi:putative MATE family efflux protein